MAQNSELETRLCLVWNTEKPQVDGTRTSSYFCLMDSVWRLRLQEDDDEYKVLLRREVPVVARREKLEKSFTVTTFVENSFKHALSRKVKVEYTERIIWNCKEDDDEPENYVDDSGSWRVICMFHDFESFVPQNENKTMLVLDQQDDLDFPAHLGNLSLDLSSFHQNSEFSEVELRCGDSTFSVHNVILAARSEVFRRKINESRSGVVEVIDLKTEDLKLLLKHMYSGKVEGPIEDVISLYKASDKYAVHALKKASADWMIENLNEENFVSFLTVAVEHNDVHFKEAVVLFIISDKRRLNSTIWLDFCKNPEKVAIEVYCRFFRANTPKLKSCGVGTSE